MGRIGTAFRAFFRVLGDGALAAGVEELLARPAGAAGIPTLPDSSKTSRPGTPSDTREPKAPAAKPSPVMPSVRHEALVLLATLQREARLVDFLQEPITDYADAQIGAAVRDIHRDAAKVLARVFALAPVVVAEEGATVDVPAGFDASQYRVLGSTVSAGPLRARLAHHGWKATCVELPAWTGTDAAARVIAPAEVEV